MNQCGLKMATDMLTLSNDISLYTCIAGILILIFTQLSINPTDGASKVLIRVGHSRFLFTALSRVEKVKVKI